MLKCKDVAYQASDYLDKSLPFWQRVNIRIHLFMCGHCRRFIKQLKSTVDVSRNIDRSHLQNQARCSDKILDLISKRSDDTESHT